MAALASPAPQLTCDDLLRLKPSLQAYLECFLSLFPRRDQGASFLAYAEGTAVRGAGASRWSAWFCASWTAT